jgi:hypothetical protein
MAGGQLAPRHVLGQYEWSAAFPVSTKAHLSASFRALDPFRAFLYGSVSNCTTLRNELG